MKRIVASLFICFLSSSLIAFEFIDSSLEQFADRVVAVDDRVSFKNFYQDFIAKLQDLTVTQRKNELQRLRELARCSLEIKHADWAVQLKPYAFYERDEDVAQGSQLKSIRLFLTRYAAYEEFLKNRVTQQASIWGRVKTYTAHVSSKVSTWVSSVYTKNKTT